MTRDSLRLRLGWAIDSRGSYLLNLRALAVVAVLPFLDSESMALAAEQDLKVPLVGGRGGELAADRVQAGALK